MRRILWLAALLTAGAALAAGAGTATTRQADASPIKIGASLPLTGDFADPGKEAKRGYEVWQTVVNAAGGVLGRPVQMVIKDDASDQNTIVADYNALIARDRVDLLLGTFSSLLNLPASAVAERHRMVYVEPAGGSPEMFSRGFKYLFFAQQATSQHQADLFARWVKSLPPAQRPKTAAYVSLDDPFASPVISGVKDQLSKAGIKTVYDVIYPQGTSNFDAIANAIKAKHPDLLAHGALSLPEGVGLTQALMKVGYNPKQFFETNSPSLGAQYSDALGLQNTQGIFYAVSYSPAAKTHQNAQFLATYHKLFKGQEPAEDAADAFAAAQVLQTAVTAVGKLDQAAIATWLHHHAVDTILGRISWDAKGAPQQAFMLAQWQAGKSQIVAPASVATSGKTVNPKPAWK